jgi:flagellar hook-associated protein 2
MMADPISFVSGLASGIDWREMVDQLIAVDHKAVDLLTSRKDEYNQKVSAWQEIQTKLLALRTASQALSTRSGFSLFQAKISAAGAVDPGRILSATVGTSAAEGSYAVKVIGKAQAQKLSSKGFGSQSQTLGLSGGILINGRAVQFAATDSLQGMREKINALNTGENASGVSASIIQYGTADYRLILSSDQVGASGFGLLNADATDLLETMGWTDGSSILRNGLQGGAKSDAFRSSSAAIGGLLGLSSAQSGTVMVDGAIVDIDLSADSLIDIEEKIVGAGKQANLITETQDGQTVYRLLIETKNFTDDNNVFETLGVLAGGLGDVLGLQGSAANTTGGSAITASTLIKDIDGYTDYISGDTINISGTDHNGGAVGPSNLTVTDATTVQDLLDDVESLFGNVIASVTPDGQIQVADLESGESQLTLTVTPSSSLLDFGTFGTASTLREREIQAGKDAQIEVDGVILTRSTNLVDDVIEGVTLNIEGEDDDATLYLDIERDLEAVQEKIQGFVDAYNDVMGWISQQFTYDVETQEKGGVLFGDSTLRNIRSKIQSQLINPMWGLADGFESLGMIGIRLNSENSLTIDSTKLNGYLQSNFEDVEALFVAKGVAADGLLEYINHSDSTQSGSYSVEITQAGTRTTVTGGMDLAGALSADEDITITDDASGREAIITLQAGWNLDAIVAAVNSELSSEKTEVHRGSNATGYNETTAWSGIDGADDGDVITFSGTNRYGATVTSSYTVDASGTLRDLLNAVESAFGNQMSAALDTGGELVLTDNRAGDSQLTFSIDSSDVSGLDFGTVSVDTEGRYSLPATASRDADRLKLTHQDYGSGQAITTQGFGSNSLGLGGLATQVAGVDVAGTINGAEATGKGRILTLDQEGNNADGLSLFYTGTDPLSTTFTLTLGVGESFARELGFITDSGGGTIQIKTNSLGRTISRLEGQIEDMETRLERRRQRLILQFVTMEKTLNTLQSQMNWLSGQITGMFSQ